MISAQFPEHRKRRKEITTIPDVDRSEIYLEIKRKASVIGREAVTAVCLINKKAREANHGAHDVCWEFRKLGKDDDFCVQCLECLYWCPTYTAYRTEPRAMTV
jgi:NAD-dependent dihydropyrimidine dehydrogenase PreA subunit